MIEQDILKYLDNELPEKEKEAFEENLRREPVLKHKLEAVREKRREALEAIGMLNPSPPLKIPDFSVVKSAGKKRNLFALTKWRAAAAILILAVASGAYFFLPGGKTENTLTAENAALQKIKEDAFCNELDYYISPNRCWNRRELIWTKVSNHQ